MLSKNFMPFHNGCKKLRKRIFDKKEKRKTKPEQKVISDF